MNNNCRSYNTKQRAIILDEIRSHKDHHYTADDLFEILKNNNTPVGRATLYRYLDILVQSGEVKKYTFEENTSAYFQYAGEHCDDHYHLKCSICGKLYHVYSNEMNQLKIKLKKKYGFDIDTSKVILYGICDECQKEGKYEKEVN